MIDGRQVELRAGGFRTTVRVPDTPVLDRLFGRPSAPAAPGSRAAVCQVDGGRWLTLEGPAEVTDDPDSNLVENWPAEVAEAAEASREFIAANC